ncbi:hypothetical protein ACSBR2_003336 [Camellia fascicularis]
MITYPFAAEQFFIESLIVDVLKIGIRVGNEECLSYTWEPKVTVTKEKVEAAVKWLLGGGGGGDEVEEMRRRAKELSVKAKKAVNHGGSSDADVVSLINELKSRRKLFFTIEREQTCNAEKEPGNAKRSTSVRCPRMEHVAANAIVVLLGGVARWVLGASQWPHEKLFDHDDGRQAELGCE